jgi:hypothetical protein
MTAQPATQEAAGVQPPAAAAGLDAMNNATLFPLALKWPISVGSDSPHRATPSRNR